MLRRAALAVAGGGGVAGAYGYKWANDNLGSDALDRIIQVCACLHATLLQIGDALCACGPQFDKVALPAIIDYKVTEARCEKLPKLLPQLFSEVPEVNRRYANPNPNPNPNPNRCPRPSSCGAMRCCTRSISSRSSIFSCSLAVRLLPTRPPLFLSRRGTRGAGFYCKSG